MIIINLTGRYKIDKGTFAKDPKVSILKAEYNYEAMTVTLTAKFENTQYSYVRELDPAAIVDDNGLTKTDVEKIVNDNLILKKQ